MSFLSKYTKALSILFSGILLASSTKLLSSDRLIVVSSHQGSYTLQSPGYDSTLFSDLCFKAKELCRNVGGYYVETGLIDKGRGHFTAMVGVTQKNGSIDTSGTACSGINFCKPTTEILYQDDLVRVIKKARGTVGTDVLIVPRQHVNNIHALDENNPSHRNLLSRIAQVAATMATCLKGDQTYTLMTRNGLAQGVYHLHVHFKSRSILDDGELKKLANK